GGYGRLTVVLSEFAPEVTGFEREKSLVLEARRLRPSIEFVEVDSLARLPRASESCDFLMSFTVLQHMHDAEAESILAEIKRIAGGGFVLLVEETDASFRDGDL